MKRYKTAIRDLNLSLYSPMAYIFMIVFSGLLLFLYFRGFFVVGEASMRFFFTLLPWFFIIFVPAITMRSFAEEQKTKTIEILLTYPTSTWKIVFDKFLAAFLLLTITLAFTLSVPITLFIIGSPDIGEIVSGYIGALLLGASYVAIGIFASSLSKNQVISFILGVIFSFVLYFLGQPLFTLGLSNAIASFLSYMSLGSHFDAMVRGVIDTRDVVYYLSVIFIFLYATYYVLEKRR